jgi:hypothetical protein
MANACDEMAEEMSEKLLTGEVCGALMLEKPKINEVLALTGYMTLALVFYN